MSAPDLRSLLSDKAQVIPFDAPSDGTTKAGIYLEPLGLPWLLEDLALSIKGTRALVGALSAACALGRDSLTDDYWSDALSAIEDQLTRSAAIADHATRWAMNEGRLS